MIMITEGEWSIQEDDRIRSSRMSDWQSENENKGKRMRVNEKVTVIERENE